MKKLAPSKATVIKNNTECLINISDLQKNDIFIVKSGESIPCDGIIIEGKGSINESTLTGESLPVDKSINSEVFTATILESGFIKCKATNIGKDSSLSRIINLVENAASSKSPSQKTADKIASIFVPSVIFISLITFLIWIFISKDLELSLRNAVNVLVISCPCALGLATPVSIMVGTGVGAKNGILFKNAEVLENISQTDIVIFDKTGTLTKGEPEVTDIIPSDNISKEELVSFAVSIESVSSHPLAKAVSKLSDKDILQETKTEISNFQNLPGLGLTCNINGKLCISGNEKLTSLHTYIPESMSKIAHELSGCGKTPLFFTEDKKFLGIIAVTDALKKTSTEAINELKKMKLRTVMLTGDNKQTANYIAELAGIEEVYSELLPEDKDKIVKDLSLSGITCMVGDGINDAPALTRAHSGIAIGNGTDIAIDACGIVLMKNDLLDIPGVIRLSKAVHKNIRQNLFWAFFYNIICIPLAAGAFSSFGLHITPMIGSFAMSLSSLFVVSNALRLNRLKIKNEKTLDFSQSQSNKSEIKGDLKMEKTLNIEGMMCKHCVAHVKEALEKIEGVCSADVSLENKTAKVTLSKNILDEVFIKAIHDAGYEVK